MKSRIIGLLVMPILLSLLIMKMIVKFILKCSVLVTLFISGTVYAANNPPVANPGGPYTSVIGSADGSGSFDPDGDPLIYRWNFGDGATGTGVSPHHVYGVPGTYILTLTVNDGIVDSLPVSTTVVVGGNTGPNLLTNSGFEIGDKTGWSGSGSIDTSNVRSGSFAWKVQGVSTGYYSIIQKIPVTAGNQYRATGWIALSGRTTGNIVLQVWWYKSDGTEVSSASRITLGSSLGSNSSYVERTADVTPPVGAVEARFRMQTNKTNGIGYLDDVSMVELTSGGN